MRSVRETLMDTYSHIETGELLSLYNSGHLTSEGYDALENVLISRGVEPPKRPQLPEENREERSVVGWTALRYNFFGALTLSVIAHRIFLQYLPSPALVEPGSLKEIIVNLFADSVEFIAVFIIVSIPIVVFSRLRKKPRKDSVPRLLNIALVVTLVIEGLLICGGWYAAV